MDVEVLSLTGKGSADISPSGGEIEKTLSQNGFSLSGVSRVSPSYRKIISALNSLAESANPPRQVVITEALDTRDSKSFRKKFAEVVTEGEKKVNASVPKDYWHRRNLDFMYAKKRGADERELEELTDKYKMFRKKTRIFSLNDMGRGYRGYCFMYDGMQVAVLPQSQLTQKSLGDMICLACIRSKSNFENSAEDYPEGFSDKEFIPPKTGFVNNFVPRRGDGGKEVARKCVVIASFLVFAVALGLLLYNMVYLSLHNAELNGEIQKIAHSVDDDNTSSDGDSDERSINWDDLLAANDEIIGWLQIKDTHIDYPVLWHKADTTNQQYYLNHNWKGDWDSYGSVFVDYRSTQGASSKNIVLHAHHMQDGTMFCDLMNFGGTTGDLDFYKETPTFTFDTPDGNGTYKIISVFKTNTLSAHGEFFNYMISDFTNDKDFMDYVYNVRIRSLFNCPVDVNEDDTLITLSTCSYEFTNFRTVVVARKVRDGESTSVDVSKASLNENAVWPQVYYNSYGGTRPTVTDFDTAYQAGEISWYDGNYDDIKEVKATESTTSTSDTDEDGNTTKSATEAKTYCTVTFINYDYSVISTQQVEYGESATPPEEDPTMPSTEGFDYVFTGWGLDYSNVTCDMTIAPVFEAVEQTE